MDCPSCNNKAKEQGPDRIICGTCGDLSRVAGEWIPTEAGPPEPIPEPVPSAAGNVEPIPEPPDPEPIPEPVVVDDEGDEEEDWLTRVDLGVGRGE